VAQRRRLDAELVRRGLTSSRREATELIGAGRVLVAGAVADKSARLVSPAEAIVVEGPPPRFVSRGGEKLDAALDAFGLDVTGWRALDAGASTGGFTDCLLQRGASHVVALDVGHGQLHERIRGDRRVTVIERYNVRHLQVADIGGPVELVVADLSFISLKVVLPALLAALRPGGDLVALVKPQFEAGRQEVARGRGIITDPEVHRRVRSEIDESLRSLSASVVGWITSPIQGADGNIEFLVHARAPEGSAWPPS
jgi:23S rRNA (cytidine1920-2'-O)/16S rRNA (cytidine1409-2'-O)-methyltransferase